MKKLLFGVLMAASMSVLANPFFDSISTDGAEAAPSCNWGALTASSIEDGFAQGDHSSDPSGDGHGPGTADEPRAGLANVVDRGNLEATCELKDSLLP